MSSHDQWLQECVDKATRGEPLSELEHTGFLEAVGSGPFTDAELDQLLEGCEQCAPFPPEHLERLWKKVVAAADREGIAPDELRPVQQAFERVKERARDARGMKAPDEGRVPSGSVSFSEDGPWGGITGLAAAEAGSSENRDIGSGDEKTNVLDEVLAILDARDPHQNREVMPAVLGSLLLGKTEFEVLNDHGEILLSPCPDSQYSCFVLDNGPAYTLKRLAHRPGTCAIIGLNREVIVAAIQELSCDPTSHRCELRKEA